MALEATVICIDNSEWMRNGDFVPSRFESQQDACVSICGTKTHQNPESSVGLVSTAGRAVEVVVPLTQDLGKLVAALHKVKISSESNIVAGIRVAQLALRHRQKTGKKQEQRIILFVGSPVGASKQELEDLGKQLKKNSIALDIVSFGEPNTQENEEKLQALLNAANNLDDTGKDNSHYVPVVEGNLTDALIQMTGEQPGAASSASTLDPELAWAMELSKQTFEQERGGKTEQKDETKDSTPSAPSPAPAANPFAALGMEDIDDPELLAAIQMSLQAEGDPELLQALTLSQQTAKEDVMKDKEKETKEPATKEETKPEQKQPATDNSQMDLSDLAAEDIESALLQLPLDKEDPEIQKLLQALKEDKEKK